MLDSFERSLMMIAERGAEGASQALSKWLGRPVQLTVSEARQIDLSKATCVLGPEDALVASCSMELRGALTGQLLFVFEDQAGFGLVDWLLNEAEGTTRSWGELEQSAVKETANIVGCAYLNALAAHLPPGQGRRSDELDTLLPSPPAFRHEFAASLLEFALMDQAMGGADSSLIISARFGTDSNQSLSWSLFLIPSSNSVAALTSALATAL